ncbi:MAG: hypothetical protein HY875_03645 [Chloroflexi bacterium]|nr:hypothetical protein [Chloroflexota bacterium]
MRERSIILAAAAAVFLVAFAFIAATMVFDGDAPAPPAALAAPAEAAAAAGLASTPVTMADLEAANAAVRTCLGEAGYEVVILLPGEGLRPTRYTFYGVTDVEGIRAANTIWADCRTKHSNEINNAWLAQKRKPTVEQLEDLHDRLVACVASGGVPRLTDAVFGRGANAGRPVSVGFSPDANTPTRLMDIRRGAVNIYAGCALQMEAETGLASPFPWPSYLDDFKAGIFPPPPD